MADRHFNRLQVLVPQLQDLFLPVKALDLLPVELGENLVQILSDAVDEIALPRLFFGEGHALQYPLLRQFGVASALGHKTADIGGGIVFHLFLHDFVHLAPTQRYGMSGSGVGAGSHDGQIAGQQDKESCRCGSGAAGPDKDQHRNFRPQYLLDDFPHGSVETARRTHLDDHGSGAFLLCLFQASGDVLRNDGVNHIVDLQSEHDRLGRGTAGRQNRQQHHPETLSGHAKPRKRNSGITLEFRKLPRPVNRASTSLGNVGTSIRSIMGWL